MMASLAAFLLALFSAVAVARRRRHRVGLPARTVIVSPRRPTVVNDHGAVRSVQSAEITVDSDELERLWNPANLERLGRTYWRFLTRVTLGLIRVIYGEDERSVVLLARPLTLLRFAGPEYVMEPRRGTIRWRIRDGLLVARAGRGSGYLSLDVRRCTPGPDGKTVLKIEVEVANFYPAIAAGYGIPVYKATQSVVHVLVTHAFLRSLARLDLAVSKVGRFEAAPAPAETRERSGAPQP
jgi:hypothetical protein